MSYWGKMTNTLGTIAGSVQGNTDIQAEFKKKDKLIKDLQAEVEKLKEDMDFINKSY